MNNKSERTKCQSSYIEGLSDAISIITDAKKASISRMERDILRELIDKIEELKELC